MRRLIAGNRLNQWYIAILATWILLLTSSLQAEHSLNSIGPQSVQSIFRETTVDGNAEGYDETIVDGNAEGYDETIVDGNAEGYVETIVDGNAEGYDENIVDGQTIINGKTPDETSYRLPQGEVTTGTKSDTPLSAMALLNSLQKAAGSANTSGAGGGQYGLYAILGLTIFSLAPAILVMITSFTRIVIVLHFVRRALGLQDVPPNQVLMGLALFLTFFSMSGLINHIGVNAVMPYLDGKLTPIQAVMICEEPVKNHLLHFVRDKDLHMLFEVSQSPVPATALETPMTILIPAYVLGELRAAFIIGLVIFLPFLAIDIIVSVILLSSGLTMLSPATVSLPFKLLLFVLVDGWSLIIGSLVRSVSL
jgi:flagellar biosynthetic protein FliP